MDLDKWSKVMVNEMFDLPPPTILESKRDRKKACIRQTKSELIKIQTIPRTNHGSRVSDR